MFFLVCIVAHLMTSVSAIPYIGCYVDSGDRVLSAQRTVLGDNAPDVCAHLCRNHKYAGLEAGVECFCGDSLNAVKRPESECNSPCPGNKSKMCGAGWRINVYNSQGIFKCESKPCQNGGTCADTLVGYQCYCQDGWRGPQCSTRIPACESKPCQNGGTCVDIQAGGYQCNCLVGWRGLQCSTRIPACESNPCQNGSTCMDTQAGGYECNCQVGWRGLQCSTRIPACESKPCQNGGTCVETQAGGYQCNCQVGWRGPQCLTRIPACESNPCKNGSTCVDTQAGGYQCNCQVGWEGPQCTTTTPYIGCYEDHGGRVLPTQKYPPNGNSPDVCARLCRNHTYTGLEAYGECFCGDSLNAVKKPESECNYPCPGNKSKMCGGHWRISVYITQGISECESKPCQNGGTCADTIGGYLCYCQDGWLGPQCSTKPTTTQAPVTIQPTTKPPETKPPATQAPVTTTNAGGNLTYNCPVRGGGTDYAQFNPYTDGLRADTIESLAFQTMGNNDAHILLQNNNNDFNSKVVEIVIGGWGNGNSVIRNQQQGPALSDYRGSVLSGSSFLWFWISWNGGCVKVGKGSTVGGSQIMEWCGLDYRINGIRFSYGYGSGGTFIIPLRQPTTTKAPVTTQPTTKPPKPNHRQPRPSPSARSATRTAPSNSSLRRTARASTNASGASPSSFLVPQPPDLARPLTCAFTKAVPGTTANR